MKKWYKVSSYSAVTDRSFINYRYLEEGAENYNSVASTAEECDPAVVPYITRALAEITLEQIRDELKSRGWEMTLS